MFGTSWLDQWVQYRLVGDVIGAALLALAVVAFLSVAVVDIFNSKRRPHHPRWRKVPGSTL